MVKLADNLWIDLNIALANELAKLADALPFPIDVMEVIGGANSLKKGQHYVNILYPANGVGGYCLTKDPWFVDAIGRRAGRRHEDPARLARGERFDAGARLRPGRRLPEGEAGSRRRTPRSRCSASPSRATPATAASRPVGPLVRGAARGGLRRQAQRSATRWCTEREAAHHGITLEPDWARTVEGADAVLILAGHDEFAAIDAGGPRAPRGARRAGLRRAHLLSPRPHRRARGAAGSPISASAADVRRVAASIRFQEYACRSPPIP